MLFFHHPRDGSARSAWLFMLGEHRVAVTVELFSRFSFLLMYSMEHSSPSKVCKSIVPRPVSKASVCRMKGLLKLGSCSTGQLVNACFRVWNACSITSDHQTLSGCPFLSRPERGGARDDKFRTNL